MSFLFVDRILEFTPGKTCRGLKHVTYDDLYLFRDVNNNLCFNPSMIGETLGQLAAWNAMFSFDFKRRPVAGVVESAKINRNVLVGETIFLEATIDNLDETAVQYNACAKIDNEEVFTITSALGPMLPMNDFIDDDLIRKQFNEISRPAAWQSSAISLADISFQPPTNISNIIYPTYDKIIELEPGVKLVAIKKISRQAPYFPDHFPNKPVLPMTILIDCNIDLAHRFISKSTYADKYHLTEIRKIKMNDFVYPGDEIVSSVTIKNHDEDELILRYRTEVLGKRVCVLEIVMCRKI